jgi:hypothetical protein
MNVSEVEQDALLALQSDEDMKVLPTKNVVLNEVYYSKVKMVSSNPIYRKVKR